MSTKAFSVTLVSVVALAVSAASAATIRKTGTGAAYTGPFTARSIGNVTFATSSGTVTCVGSSLSSPASFGYGTISNSAVGSTSSTAGTLTKLIFGNPLVNPTATTSTNPCPSTIPNLNPCTYTVPGNIPISASTNSSGAGADFRLGPLTLTELCTGSGGGTVTCGYTSGVSGFPQPVTVSMAFNSVDVVATNQPFHKSSGPAVCWSSQRLSVKYNVFGTVASSTSGGSTAAADRLTVTNP